jgi:hypothetical protein
MTAGYREFEFNLPDALLTELVSVLDSMPSAPLLTDAAQVPEAQGVYQLLFDGNLVYIGKTDAEAGLRGRLERHAWTVQNRQNLDPAKMTFRAVRVFVFTAMDLETQLIKHYGDVPWNFSGFGANDPGRNRDRTEVHPEGFDAQYPIDVDKPLTLDIAMPASAADVLDALKSAVPYVFRFERAGRRKRAAHADLTGAQVNVPTKNGTVRSTIDAVFKQIPKGWQATELPARVIIYKENFNYEFGKVIARS